MSKFAIQNPSFFVVVCLIIALRDLAQFQVRNQTGSVPGAGVPQPFGGRYRQIMVYTDRYKLEAHQLSLTARMIFLRPTT
jgi:Cu/Ag efflux pump CusA